MAYPYDEFDPIANTSPANTSGDGGEMAADMDARGTALNDLLTELGENPKGTDDDVTARLARLEALAAVFEADVAWAPTDQGYRTWSIDPAFWALNSTSLVLGTLYLVELVVPPGTLTGVAFRSATGGTLTNFYASVFDSGAVRLGQSANIATTVQATGDVRVALTAPLTFSTRTIIRVGLQSAGSAQCAIGRAGSSDSSNTGLSTSTARFASANTGLTTTVPSSHGSMTLVNSAFGVAVY